ncbi:MAG: hypothetical protein COA65_07370 [Rhodospirillaceae bacterium]|nr:MAG: hypothetical protein COA65_07370 [Rhodospirillaceae bacterium]
MQPPSNIARKKTGHGITLSVLLHLSFLLPFIVIAFPVLRFAKELPPTEELAKELSPAEESKAPSSLDEVDAMMVDILSFSENEPESLAPSKFLGINGTRQTLEFEEDAPDSVPRTDLVESLEPAKEAEKEIAAKEERDGEAKAPLKKATEERPAQHEQAQREQTQRPPSIESITQEEEKAQETTEPVQAGTETATAMGEAILSRKASLKTPATAMSEPAKAPATSEPAEAVASKLPPATGEERTLISASDDVVSSPEAAHHLGQKKTTAPEGPLGELLQTMRERNSRLDRALRDAPEEELRKFRVQSILRLQDAAAQGYAHAQHGLAEMLMRGTPGEIPEEAKKLLTRAAKSGYVEAQVLLGYLAASGKSEKRDLAEALAWIQLAAERGHKTARYGAKRLEKLLTIEEIIQARQRTQRYRYFETSVTPAVTGIDDERTPDEVLRDASAAGNAELVQIMLARGADPNAIDDSGRSALINAAWRGRKKVIELLLEKGTDLTIRDREGLSAINWAGVNGHSDVIYLLGKAGANLNNRDNDNLTPLMRAAWNGHTKAVAALLSEGANPNLQTPSGKSALDFADKEGYTLIQKMLQKAIQP